MTAPIQFDPDNPFAPKAAPTFDADNPFAPKAAAPAADRGYAPYGAGQEAARSATMGWSDKLIAAVRALTNKGTNYQAEGDALQAERQKYESAHPVASKVGAGAGIAGTLPLWLMGGSEAAGAGLLGRVAAGVGTGALGGAAAGAGYAPVGQEGSGALAGGVVGAGLGAALPLAGGLGRWALHTKLGQAGSGAVNDLVRSLTGAGATSVPAVGMSPEGEAWNILSQHPAFEGDRAAMAARALGKDEGIPLTLAQVGQRDRTAELLKEIAQRSPGGRKVLDDVTAQSQAAANPLYAAARSRSVDVTPEMGALLDHPVFQDAYEQGAKIAQTEGKQVPALALPQEDAMTQTAKSIGRAFGGAGSALDIARTMTPSQLALPGNAPFRAAIDAATGSPTLPVEALDYMKRGLDAVIDRGESSGHQINNDMARALRDRLNKALALADQQVPEYGQARGTAAVYKNIADAVEAGKQTAGKELLEGPGGQHVRPYELMGALEGRPWWGARVAEKVLGSGKPVDRAGPQLARLLMTGAGGPYGNPAAVADLLKNLAAARAAQSQTMPLLPVFLAGQIQGGR